MSIIFWKYMLHYSLSLSEWQAISQTLKSSSLDVSLNAWIPLTRVKFESSNADAAWGDAMGEKGHLKT